MTLATIVTPSVSPPAPIQLPGTVLLRHISWDAYEKLSQEVGDDAVHLTYDNGFLEIEVPSERREQLKAVARSILEDVLRAARTPFEPMGSTKWKAQKRLKGIEADECYYIQHASDVKGKRPIDLAVSPPPDLAIEVEVTASAIDKLGIYSALRIPEVWRIDESGEVVILQRQENGTYTSIDRSIATPTLTTTILSSFLRRLKPDGSVSSSDIIYAFSDWLAAQKSE